jgi:putative ATP-dependent endonuclease of OLD family
VSEIDNLEHEVNEILALFLDREKIHLDMVPVKDEDLIQRIGIDVGDYSVLKHGSGYQSLLVLVLKLFKALYMVIKREEVDFRSFIVAIEEPESHLHPHLQRHLIRALMEIQKKFRADDIELQLIISTHSPHTLVTISPENLTLLRSTTESSSPNGLKLIKEEFIEEVSSITPVDAATLRKRKKQLSRWLSQFFNTYAEVFFSRCVIVGEGDTEQGAIPVFSEKIIGDLDKYGVSFLNGEGDKLTYPIKLLSKLKIPWVLIIDKDKKETIKSLPEYKEEVVFCTDEIAFEAEIISKVPLPKILEVIDIIAIPERNDERIKHVKGYFTELKGATIASITEILNYLEQENVNKFKQEFVLKWLRDEKGLALGKNLAELTDKEEIPQAFVKAVEKAAEISEALEL